MVVGRSTVFPLLQLSLLLLGGQVHAEEDQEQEDQELPPCFETDKAYIGYPMNNSETGGRYLEECPSPQHCQMMCQEDDKCEWFNWLKFFSNETEKHVSRCWMKEGKGKATNVTGVITGPKYCKPKRSCIERDRMYIGDGLNKYKDPWVNNFGREKTEASCQDLCKRTEGCEWFNWNKDSKCWLKKSHGQQIKPEVWLERGVSTGPKECLQIPAGKGCDEGWHYFDEKCYLVNLNLISTTVSYEYAKQMCLDNGAYLVALETIEEFNFISDILDKNYFQQNGVDFWVGAERTSDEEEYRWTNTNVKLTTWLEEQLVSGNECLQLVKDDFETWVYVSEECEDNDDDGSYICEKFAIEIEEEESFDTEDGSLAVEVSVAEDGAEEGSVSQSDDMENTPCSTPTINNGNMDCSDEFDCLLTCAPGYSPYPHTRYACADGAWTRAAHSSALPLEDIRCSSSKLLMGGCSVSNNETMIQLADSTGTCRLPSFPGDDMCAYGYSLDFVDGELLACGGYPNPQKCLRFDYKNATWQVATELKVSRMDAVSIVMGSSIYLVGGSGDGQIEIITPSDSFDSKLDVNQFPYDVSGDCSVAISSDIILTLAVDNTEDGADRFFSYNVTSGAADDLSLDMAFMTNPVQCTLFTDEGAQKVLVTLAEATQIGETDFMPRRSFLYDVKTQAWSDAGFAPQSDSETGRLVTMEGGNIHLIYPTAEADRMHEYTPEAQDWDYTFDSEEQLEQSSINGPAATVPGDLFTCERFGLYKDEE